MWWVGRLLSRAHGDPPVLTAAETDARHDVGLVAAALIDAERRHRCGATVNNLSVYVVERAMDWRPS